jgi:UDP-N-acetylglucosamine 2-epimerase (non-hydrolysing)
MILFCYGTRPEYLKIRNLIKECKNFIPHKVLFIKQHKDLVVGDYDFLLNVNDGKNRLDTILSSILSDEIDTFFDGIKYVLVQGDTASAFGLSLAAFHRKIKVIHLEAGLRTNDKENPFPEEIYRQLISRISDINLCPTELNKQNLIYERVLGHNYVVGNTILDNLNKEDLEYSDNVLVTLHRRENHNDMKKWFEEIEKLATKYSEINFILPIHPNPNVLQYKNLFKKVKIVQPLEHNEFIKLLKKCKLVISDSGGIQEETSFLNKKVIVCRKITERVESLNINSFLCKDPNELSGLFEKLIYDYEINTTSPYGDGKSTEKILKLLEKL